MTMPIIANEFGIVQEPELRFSDSGSAWLKIRGKAQDRAYNPETKEWENKGDALFIDIIVSGKAAEHLFESAGVGDSIVVIGRMQQREWTTKEGEKRQSTQIRAESVGVSVRFGAAKTERIAGTSTTVPKQSQPDEAPF